ncbi:MAG: hypothetical protein ACI9MR_004848 [Myxococcota bacterium]
MKFRVHETVYETATAGREREWKQALFDLNIEVDGHPPLISVGRAADGGASFVIESSEGATSEVVLAHATLRRSFRDYLDIIQRLTRSDGGAFGMRDFETLDYAKKLVHDEAGDLVVTALADRCPVDHPTARRLFTLVFLIISDLPEGMIRNHRRHGPPK